MILVTDAHVSLANRNHEEFFEMLDHLATLSEDVVFLGDIFDLWIGLPGYQDGIHAHFLAWCREQKAVRMVGLVEGNHEFFVAERHGGNFSWCEKAERQVAEGRVLCVHGDLINRHDLNYLRFRKVSKSAIVKTLVRFLPGGRWLVQRLKKDLKKTNKAFRISLPRDEVDRFAAERLVGDVERIFVGHFHQEYSVSPRPGTALHILPDWFATRKVAHYDPRRGSLTCVPWRQLTMLESGT